MRQITFIAAIAVIALSAPAEARHHHHYRHHSQAPQIVSGCVSDDSGHTICAGSSYPVLGHSRAESTYTYASVDRGGIIGGRPSGCPHAYCGCSASLYVFGRIIPELNLAANWGRKFPPAMPGPGMAAYRAHHVFIIISVNGDGTVLAHDGNSGGHQTRVHTVSLRGYKVVDPHNSRMAMR